MKEYNEDDRITMIGASFDEIEAEISIAVKREFDTQIQRVTPVITEALNHGAVALNKAKSALLAAHGCIRHYRIALFVLAVLCAAEGGFIIRLVINH